MQILLATSQELIQPVTDNAGIFCDPSGKIKIITDHTHVLIPQSFFYDISH